MKLERFDKNKNYKKALIITLIAIILLGGGLLIYRTFALYKTSNVYNVLEGTVGRFQTGGNDITLRVKIDGEDSETFPKKGGFKATAVECTNKATGTWNSDTWGIEVGNIETNTTCTVSFETDNTLDNSWNKIIELAADSIDIAGGNGVAKVNHADATIEDIEYSSLNKPLDYNQVKENLQMTEYRYYGENPDNYVTFNGEVAGWRIIGLVNTPEGQRIKLIRANSIGEYPWDNNGSYGSNDWTNAAIQIVLNSGAYYTRTTGDCPSKKNGITKTCDFSENSETPGLIEDAKKMIDTITWNLGGYKTGNKVTTSQYYNYERGIKAYTGRPKLWQGKIGLIYPSDYGYATSGGDTLNRESCLTIDLVNWNGTVNTSKPSQKDCAYNDWLLNKEGTWQWTLMPYTMSGYHVFSTVNLGYIDYYRIVTSDSLVVPVLYLKPYVKLADGAGKVEDPYVLAQ